MLSLHLFNLVVFLPCFLHTYHSYHQLDFCSLSSLHIVPHLYYLLRLLAVALGDYHYSPHYCTLRASKRATALIQPSFAHHLQSQPCPLGISPSRKWCVMVALLTTEVGPHHLNLLLVYQNQTWPCWTMVKGSILRPQQWHFCFHVLVVHSLSVHHQKFIVTDFLLVKMTLLSLDLVSCTQSCQGYQLIILPFLNFKANSAGQSQKNDYEVLGRCDRVDIW